MPRVWNLNQFQFQQVVSSFYRSLVKLSGKKPVHSGIFQDTGTHWDVAGTKVSQASSPNGRVVFCLGEFSLACAAAHCTVGQANILQSSCLA